MADIDLTDGLWGTVLEIIRAKMRLNVCEIGNELSQQGINVFHGSDSGLIFTKDQSDDTLGHFILRGGTNPLMRGIRSSELRPSGTSKLNGTWIWNSDLTNKSMTEKTPNFISSK